jgi:flagellar motor switch protein FliM
MDKILSQDEINALFSAMSSEDPSLNAQVEPPKENRKINGYDFRRADRISQDQMRSLHLLHDYFGRNFASSLSAYLRAFVDVRLVNVDQVSYGDFVKLLPEPTLFTSIILRPLESNIAMEMNPSLVFPMIDILLGGPGTAPTHERTLTEIEMNIIEGVVKLAMRDLREAWRPIMELEFGLEGTGTKAQMFQIVSAGETVVSVAIEIKVGETSGTMNICIPSRMLKVIRSRFDQQWNIRRQKVAGSEAPRLLNLLQTAEIAVSAELRESSMMVDDLLKLAVGDVIQLNARVGDPVALCVCGIPKYIGRVVSKRGNKALEVTRPVVS